MADAYYSDIFCFLVKVGQPSLDCASVRLNLSAESTSHSTVFFYHNKSTSSTFICDFSDKRTSSVFCKIESELSIVLE